MKVDILITSREGSVVIESIAQDMGEKVGGEGERSLGRLHLVCHASLKKNS